MEATKTTGDLPPPLTFVPVRTTLPRLPIRPIPATERAPILTPRLLCRAITADDLGNLHAIRSQPEVMKWSSVGRVDRDLDETRAKLALDLPPRDEQKYNFAVYWRESGDFVGVAGNHLRKDSMGWPAIGYMFLKESWGQGVGSEFVEAFVRAYWALEREAADLEVDELTVEEVEDSQEEDGEGEKHEAQDEGQRRGLADGELAGEAGENSEQLKRVTAREMLIAITVTDNFASQRILTKCGFKLLRHWVTQDGHDPSGNTLVTLLVYGLARPRD